MDPLREWTTWKSADTVTAPPPSFAGQSPLQRPSATLPLAVAASGGTPSTDLPHQVSKKAIREQEHWNHVGGMRKPTHAVAKYRGVMILGRQVVHAFEKFEKEKPSTLGIGRHFGAKDYNGPDSGLVQNYRGILRRALEAPTGLKPGRELGRPSPLQGTVMQHWLKTANDLENPDQAPIT